MLVVCKDMEDVVRVWVHKLITTVQHFDSFVICKNKVMTTIVKQQRHDNVVELGEINFGKSSCRIWEVCSFVVQGKFGVSIARKLEVST